MPRKKTQENSAEATLDKKNLVESQKEQEQIKPQAIKEFESEQLGYSAKAEEYALSLSQKYGSKQYQYRSSANKD